MRPSGVARIPKAGREETLKAKDIKAVFTGRHRRIWRAGPSRRHDQALYRRSALL